MYCFYKKIRNDTSTTYEFVEKISLFGCNEGWIPALIEIDGKTEPFRWLLDIEHALFNNMGQNDRQSIIINLKPNQSDNVSLYELKRVIGNSENGWSQLMLCLRGLVIDGNPVDYDTNKITIEDDEIDEPIFSMMYLNGTIINGELSGKWTPPRASPTNAVLLWPHVFNYFNEEAEKVIKGL